MQRPTTPEATAPDPGPTPYAYPAAGAGASGPRPGRPQRAVDPPPPGGGPHPTRADALVLLPGAWLVAAPFVLGYDRTGTELSATANDVATGAVLVLVALLGVLTRLRGAVLWAVEVALGAWLLAAPFVLFYSADSPATAATWNDIGTGTAVIAVAVIAATLTRQGRRRTAAAPGRDRAGTVRKVRDR